ncbi:MAG TPA: hypothetical protein VGJ84_03970 [Polyangiaceae bacterium]
MTKAPVRHRAILTALTLASGMLFASSGSGHQDTIAHSRIVLVPNGDVEYALKIPVEDLAEVLGRPPHTPSNAPEVRAGEDRLFRHFLPLISISAGNAPCPVERRGIDVPEDERLYGELHFVFRCPPKTTLALDYRVFFDVDPGHVGMLEVEGSGETVRAELILEKPRWEIHVSQPGPPELRAITGASNTNTAGGTPEARPIASTMGHGRFIAVSERDSSERIAAKQRRADGPWWLSLLVLVVIAPAAVFLAWRALFRRPARPR